MKKSALPVDLPVVAAVPVPKAKLPVFTQTPTQLDLQSATGGAGSSNNSGLQVVVRLGNPSHPGPYVELLKIAPHTTGRAHHHAGDRIGTVPKGTLRLGFGPKFDESSLIALPTGSIYTEPSGVAHFAQTDDEVVIVQITGYGPTSDVYENLRYKIDAAIVERDIKCEMGEAFCDLEENRRDAASAECEWQVDPEPTGRDLQMGRELSLSSLQHRQRFDTSSVIGLALGGQPETARGPVQEARCKPRFHQSDGFTNGGRGNPQALRRSCETPVSTAWVKGIRPWRLPGSIMIIG
jgi:hypothetical protein